MSSNFGKMPISQRAKQFMPFASLKGLDEAYRQKEWEIESRQKLKDKVWRTQDEDFPETSQ